MAKEYRKRPGYRGTPSAVAFAAAMLWLMLPVPGHAQAIIDAQEKIDKELNALDLPKPGTGPTLVHLPAPQTAGPPVTGQPYQQQPAAVVNESLGPNVAGGSRGGGGGGGGFVPPSDARLKKDIRQLATLESGIKIYAFRYWWDDAVRVGVMAQDLLADPERADAVVTMANGYYAVDYARLGLRMTTLAAWRADGAAAVKVQPVVSAAAAH